MDNLLDSLCSTWYAVELLWANMYDTIYGHQRHKNSPDSPDSFEIVKTALKLQYCPDCFQIAWTEPKRTVWTLLKQFGTLFWIFCKTYKSKGGNF